MATTSPARIDDDLYASAKLAGSVQSRSASQQVAHWARIGREIEASASISHREIAEVLAGSRSYDDLDPKEQAVVRAEWAARMDERRDALDLAAEFTGAGRTWVELDDKGRVVERGGRVTKGRTTARAKKPVTKQAATKKPAAKRAPAKKATKKPAVKKAAARQAAKKATKRTAAAKTAKPPAGDAGRKPRAAG